MNSKEVSLLLTRDKIDQPTFEQFSFPMHVGEVCRREKVRTESAADTYLLLFPPHIQYPMHIVSLHISSGIYRNAHAHL